ncbi:hypothetical protein, partial [Bacteroides caecicola]|uniref:hypothetical protein n=1 Tax=Bacteroides caecicola TaxID=1462569 RepID=UPI0020128F38
LSFTNHLSENEIIKEKSILKLNYPPPFSAKTLFRRRRNSEAKPFTQSTVLQAFDLPKNATHSLP